MLDLLGLQDTLVEVLLVDALTVTVIVALPHARSTHRALAESLRTAEHEGQLAEQRAAALEPYEQDAARLRSELAIAHREWRALVGSRDRRRGLTSVEPSGPGEDRAARKARPLVRPCIARCVWTSGLSRVCVRECA
ncbi:MAG TPA: hypothetical protein VLE53_18940 [Gemmatimonadaceae bacterium]|nr:hypothetical protein [Gemmatimonadaceae bacterium]